MLAGATILQCCAEIENPVVRATNAHWLSMNAIVVLKDDCGEERKLRCLLNYFREDSSQLVTAGCYLVLAMIMGIPHRDYAPPFELHGDVFSLSSICMLATVIFFLPQLIVSGYVDSVDRVGDTFKVVTFQWVEGGKTDDELTIVAMFKSTKRWPIPNSCMSNPKGMVSFSGIVQTVRNTTVTIIIDSMSFLNNKARPTAKSLARHSKLPPLEFPCCRPSSAALRSAKRRAPDADLETWFKKEKEYFSSE
ncbi:hypothetical protein V8E53_004872 [Lactarius tabidus]